MTSRNRTISPEHITEIRDMRARGKSIFDIARNLELPRELCEAVVNAPVVPGMVTRIAPGRIPMVVRCTSS